MIKMCDILAPGTVGSARIEYYEVTPDNLRARFNGDHPGTYTQLIVNDEIMMTDTAMEWNTNRWIIEYAFGDVLIGGLGLGIVPLSIQDSPNVTSVTIIENSPDVISLIKHQLPLNSKVSVVEGDVFIYKPTQRFDVIYMDIWPTINDHVYETQMKPLISRFSRYLKSKAENPKRIVTCWAKVHAKHNIPLEA